jgi:signal transduction histidine kinase
LKSSAELAKAIGGPVAAVMPERSFLTGDRMLGLRLRLHVWIRLFVAIVIAVGAVVADLILRIENLPTRGLIMLALVIALYNAVVWWIVRPRQSAELATESQGMLTRIMFVTIVLDYLCLTAAVWMVGGVRSPFLVFYLLHVMLSCILLPRGMAITSSVLAYVLLTALMIGEWLNIMPARMPIGAVADPAQLHWRFVLTLQVVSAVMLGLTTFLLLGLRALLQEGERELRRTNDDLDRMSNVRRDFLQIAVHDVRAPVAGVIMMLSNLRNGLCGPVSRQQMPWIERCLKRLDGLVDLLKDLQILSSLEGSDIESQKTVVDLHALLTTLVEEHRDLAHGRQQTLFLDLPETLPEVMGLERMIREAVSNYMTNAIKYTENGGSITLRARHNPSVVRIEVQDNGIGIAPDDQRNLFREFVRIKVAGTTVSNVSGSGLGLSIVRQVADRHQGRCGVESEPGRGSTFYLELPAFVS